MPKFKETQLTNQESGHMINFRQVFSPKDEWIVFDIRNNDGDIKTTGGVSMVSVSTGEIKKLYEVPNQTEHGPGVGAVTFSPVADQVLFLHGIRNSDAQKPYDFTRRTGISVDINEPGQAIFMDARDLVAPFTPGALRGGTHAHSWSGDGQWISFTYNDYIIEQLALNNDRFKDLRMVGVMFPSKVKVTANNSMENNDGEFFAVIVTPVTEFPTFGSNEIDKAFDECWIGANGYQTAHGTWQKRAIAYQGNLRDVDGNIKTEVFVADLPEDLTQLYFRAKVEGTAQSRPEVPETITQRRITYTTKGVVGPRHWLVSNPQGTQIYYLSTDENDHVQVFAIEPNGGEPIQITTNPFSVTSPINCSPDGKHISYMADQSVFITAVDTRQSERLTQQNETLGLLVGAPVWSNDGKKIAFNRYVRTANGNFCQIFVLDTKE